MTEAEWLAGTDLTPTLESFGVRPKRSGTMGKAKAKPRSPLQGLWHIASMGR
jgi:hypothetical protein